MRCDAIDWTHDGVLISLTVFNSVLLGPRKGTSGARELNGEGLCCPDRLELGFGSLDFFSNFERHQESRCLPGNNAGK